VKRQPIFGANAVPFVIQLAAGLAVYSFLTIIDFGGFVTRLLF
jgi:hypothetical protein